MSQSDCQNDQFPIMQGFTVADMKKSLAFYRDALGFQMKECWPDANAPMWCSLVLGGQTIMLGQALDAATQKAMHEKHNNPAAGKFWGEQAAKFAGGAHGAGCVLYIHVADVDAYAAQIAKKGIKPALPPTSQFYGLRDIVCVDPDGYVLTFYTPITMANCQSCAMPLPNAKPGQMYCDYCVDENGHLKPYEKVFEGTVTGFFMAQQKMDRKTAEKAASAHLQKQPAWSARK